MKTRRWALLAAGLALFCCAATPARAQLAPALEYAWSQNLDAFNRKDIEAAMGTVDTRSPDYESTRQRIEEQFKTLDLEAKLVKFDLMGHDDEFAVARVKTRTTGPDGSGFADNVTDAIVLFHQERGTWKLWSEKIIAVDILTD